MNNRKLLSVSLSLVLCLGLLSPPARAVLTQDAVDRAVAQGLTVFGDVLTWYDGRSSEVVIPQGVAIIAQEAFNDRYAGNLTGVIIPDGMRYIDNRAFANCTDLTRATFLSGDVAFGQDVFYNCPNLTICGPAGSTAEAYAAACGIPFVADQAPPQMAYASTQTVSVDGAPVEFQMYALKDESGNPVNYIKVRDLAYVLSGTPAQFEVGYHGMVNIAPGWVYTPNGSEMTTPFSGDRVYREGASQTNVGGELRDLDAIVLTDDSGGDYTYYKLRDLGRALGFNVGWTWDRGVFIETDKPYDPNN